MNRLLSGILFLCLTASTPISAQSSSAFNASRTNDFNSRRMNMNSEYIKKLREPWSSYNAKRGIIPPHEKVKPIDPIRISDNDLKKDNENRKIDFESIASPTAPRGDSKPIAPIHQENESNLSFLTYTFYNTPIKIRKPTVAFPRINSSRETDIAEMLQQLNTRYFCNMLYDCVSMKQSYNLDDWPFCIAMKDFAESIYGAGADEAAVLTAYILSQSGYKIRLARGDGNKLCVLYASRHQIYHQPYIAIGNDSFYFLGKAQNSVEVCPAYFSTERPISLWLTSTPALNAEPGHVRQLTSERYPDFTLSVSSDKNIIKLLDTYPASEIGGDFMTKWAMYASTPISENTGNILYGQIRNLIAGLSKVEATERILNWVQTSLTYEYDDKVWGMDRAFFAEETLYYPYADCEDRSILFTRIIRDILNLECMLIYYPGHLASAICFESDVPGDYIELRGKRYVICDPTYIGAKIGKTMPNMDNSKAKVVLLRK